MAIRTAQFQFSKTRALLLALMIAAPCATSVAAQTAAENKRVLMLFGDDSSTNTQVIMERALRSTLKYNSSVPVETFSEYVANRRVNTGYENELVALLRQKYAGKKFDVIFTIGQFPLSILLKNGAELFPGTPFVFLTIDRRNVENLYPAPGITGVWGEINFKPNLELALSLHPGTKRVAVIQGVSETDKFWATKAKEDFREYESSLEFIDLAGLTVPETRSALASMPPHTIVFFVSHIVDKAGNSYESPDYLRQVSTGSAAPIYGTTDGQLGTGIVGGRLLSFEALGTEGARVGLRVLAGEKPEAIAPYGVPSVPMFDWRELQRWGISEQTLPPGSVVRFKEPTVWDQYKWYIIGIISLVILETLLIAYLLINRARRMRAEKEREQFAQLAAAEHKHLDEIVSNVPGIVWESLFDSATNRYQLTFISDYAEKMLGYTTEEWLSAESDLGRNFMVGDEDRDRVARNSEAVVKTGKEGLTRFRWRAKDGRVLLAESSLSPILDETGKIIGLRGVTLDVTAKHLAEEAKRQSEERNRAILQAIPDLMFLQTRDGVYVDYHAKDPVGLLVPPEAFLGKNMRDVLPPELAESLLRCFKRAEETKATQVYEYKLMISEEERWFEARIVSINGKVLSVVRDVSERKRAEEHLRESEERFRTLADSSPVLIWVNGLQGCEFVNRSYLEYLGRSLDDVRSMDWAEAIHPDDVGLYVGTYIRAFQERESFEAQFRFRRADGEYRWFKSIGLPRLTLDGKFLGYVGSSVDITDFKSSEEALQNALEEVSRLKNQLQEENVYLREEIKLEHNFSEIVGHSDAIRYVLHKIEQVAPTDSTVLIMGETGTGKELIARAIHGASLRRERPLVKVNCAALSAGLIESELFGHEKGAFTGATARKIGRFELANGATIFLDEVGELPTELQVKLLRVIQEGEFERLGGTRTLTVDARIIAATNRNLWDEVQNGRFREDLWYRLNVFPITTPPLRQRKEDIPLLVEHFVGRFSKKLGKKITSVAPATLNALTNYSWPGNVRELANVMERAVINNGGSVLHLGYSLDSLQAEALSAAKKTLEEIEREYIISILDETSWRIEGPQGAAMILGLHPSTLRTRMAKLKIQKPSHTVV